MAKEILNKSQAIGGDGAMVSEKLVLDEQALKLQIEVSYPSAKLLSPVMGVLDGAKEKIKSAIPGNYEDAIVDGLIDGLKAEILKVLTA